MATLSNSLLTRSEAYELINQRFKKLYHPLMTIAYLCDPVTRDKMPVEVTDKQIKGTFIILLPAIRCLTDKQIKGVGGWLLKHYKNDEKKTATVYAELLELRAKSGPFSRPLDWEAAKKMDLVLWWKSLFSSHTELIQLAKWALSISPTTGAAERNWSAFGYIHSKSRNSLLNDRVNKLVYIYWNLRIRERIGDERNTWFDDEEDKDEEKDKDLVEALFEPDVYKFGDNEVDQEDVEDYDI
jgi:hypothetical protein